MSKKKKTLEEKLEKKRAKVNRKQPMQPIEFDSEGVIRFRRNKLVEYLLDNGGLDMNALARVPDVTREDKAQFAQLIGYSVSGYGDLSYATSVRKADRIASIISASKPE